MKKLILIISVFTVVFGCKVHQKNLQQLDANISAQDLNLMILLRGVEVPDSQINIDLVEVLDSSDVNILRDTFYDVSHEDWIFRIRKEYLLNSGEKSIRYDDRSSGNVVKKELSKESISFVRKYFILDTGLDDIYLLPVIKKKAD